jgi:hypothetical protein
LLSRVRLTSVGGGEGRGTGGSALTGSVIVPCADAGAGASRVGLAASEANAKGGARDSVDALGDAPGDWGEVPLVDGPSPFLCCSSAGRGLGDILRDFIAEDSFKTSILLGDCNFVAAEAEGAAFSG